MEIPGRSALGENGANKDSSEGVVYARHLSNSDTLCHSQTFRECPCRIGVRQVGQPSARRATFRSAAASASFVRSPLFADPALETAGSAATLTRTSGSGGAQSLGTVLDGT